MDKGFLIYEAGAGGGKVDIYFVRLPSAAMEITRKEWVIRGLPSSGAYNYKRAIHPPSNLLAIPVVSEGER
jgi:hypothetical protein